MPLIDLARVTVNQSAPDSNYYVGAVVNSSSGPKEIKVISNLNELETYFPDLEYKEGYKKILAAGAFLALKRIENNSTRVSTLRLTSNPKLRYVYPLIYDSIEFNPINEGDNVTGIIVEPINNGLPLGSDVFNDDDILPIEGIIYGAFNEGDSIKCEVNNVSYTSTLMSDGTFKFSLDKENIVMDPYSRLKYTLFTLKNGLIEEINDYSDYSMVGLPNISIKLSLFSPDNVIDTTSIPDSVNTFNVEGLVSGDYSQGDLVKIYLDTILFTTQCNPLGKFSLNVPLDLILSNNLIVAEVDHVFNEFTYKAKDEMKYVSDFLDLDLTANLANNEAYKEIQTLETKTLTYEIDFKTSQLIDEDYIIIPRADFANWNSNLMVYYVDSPTKTPDDFAKPVSLQSVSTPQFRLLIPSDPIAKNLMRINRARYIYDLFTGAIGNVDTGVIKKLCKVDEVNNRVTLVFSAPVSDISYYSSNDAQVPFVVKTNQDLNAELLTTYSRNDSIVSFSTLLEGDSEVKINLTHIEGYKFYLTESNGFITSKYYVSLFESDTDYNNQNIFLEEVLNDVSVLLKCKVHKLPDDPKSLEGDYLVSRGIKGKTTLSDIDLYEDSVRSLFESDIKLNVFLTDVFMEKEYLSKLNPYLQINQVVGFTMIPDEVLNYSSLIEFQANLDQFLLPVESREYLIYSFGRSEYELNKYIPSYFYQVKETISADFIGKLPDNVILSYLRKEEIDIFNLNWINYLEETNSDYNIIELVNHPMYLDPVYLMLSIYIKQILTRFLHSQIGEYPMNIFFELNITLSTLRRFSGLIKSLKIENFEIKTNLLVVRFELELTGLMGKNLLIEISLNTNN